MLKLAYVLGTVDALDYIGYLDEEQTTERTVVLKDPLAVEYKDGIASLTMGMLPKALGVDLRSTTYVSVSRERVMVVFTVNANDPHPLVKEYLDARNRLAGMAVGEVETDMSRPVKTIIPDTNFYRREESTYYMPVETSHAVSNSDSSTTVSTDTNGTFYTETTETKTIPLEDAPKEVQEQVLKMTRRNSRKPAPTGRR